jgi:predicted nucleotidyltransferase
MVKQVAKRLDTLRDSVVFVGGAVVDLLITDPAAPSVRPTKDVDVIVEVASLREYHQLGNPLRDLGFKENSQAEGGPICRWVVDAIKVDIMPTHGEIIGFSSDFYSVAVETAVTREIAEGLTIRLVSAPCFLATKLDAFKDRGEDDFMGSSDIEDVVALLDGRPEIIDEIRDSPLEVKRFLVKTFGALLENEEFVESLQGHLPPDSASQKRLSFLMERIQTVAVMDIEVT